MYYWEQNHVMFCKKCMDYRVPNSNYPDVGDTCKVCGNKLTDTNMSYHEFSRKSDILYEELRDKKTLIALQKLKETDPVKYEVAMERYKDKKAKDRQKQQELNKKPTCPTCGSTDIEKISNSKKAIGFAMIGVFSSNFGKTMECKKCGYKW